MAIGLIRTARRSRRFLTYDLEWIPGTMQLRMVGVYDGERYRYYTSVEAFLAGELTEANAGCWFYAHAGGMHDVSFVFQEIVARGGHHARGKHIDPPWDPWIDMDRREQVVVGRPLGKNLYATGNASSYTVDASFSSSSAIIVWVRRGAKRARWCFIDSYWLLRVPLAKIAKWIGMEKGEGVVDANGLPFDKWEQDAKKEWYATVPLPILRDYNEQDCVILWKAIDEFETTLTSIGGQLQMTLASSAMHLFRREFLAKNIKTDMALNNISRHTYVGSRVEPFMLTSENIKIFDINSSFPYAMTQPCPGEKIGQGRQLPDNPDAIYVADCEVTVRDAHVPPVPYRIKDRVFFPTGTWRSWFTSVDLQLIAREGGRVHKVRDVIRFAPFNDLSAYAKQIYEMRKSASGEFEKIVYKLLLNSLYGKFAENDLKSSMHVFPAYEDYMSLRAKEESGQAEMLFPGVWLEDRTVEVDHMHVPISSHITALARKTLFDYLKKAVKLSYCDTDSIMSQSMYPTSKELGGLKLEHIWSRGEFYSPKVYRGWCTPDCPCRKDSDDPGIRDGTKENVIVKAKGFSLGRKGKEQQDRFERLSHGERIDVQRQSRIKEMYRNKETVPVERTIRKKFQDTVVKKRKFLPDGTTRPWTVKELEEMIK